MRRTTILLTLIGVIASACSSWSPVPRSRYGQRAATGYVTGQGLGAVCIIDLDRVHRRLPVAERKQSDLANADLIGKQVAFFTQDGLVSGWSKDGRAMPMRFVPPVDLATCQPIEAADTPCPPCPECPSCPPPSCPPVTEACALLGAAMHSMSASRGGANHHPEVGLATELLCEEKP